MEKGAKILLLTLAVIVPLLYSLFTDHRWEDYYITYKFSKNLATGNGLVYHEGEKVHGFTSPIGTLLPALTYRISGSDDGAIWLFRILFAIPAFAAGAFFLLKTSEVIFKNFPFITYFAVLMYILDAKSVMFSVNGMETAFMLFFLSWLFYITISDPQRKWFQLGICWAGLMWTRPDSCVYVANFAISAFIFLPIEKKIKLKIFAKAALVCTALYLPWFLWAWSYYGSPVPHTVIAKNAGLLPDVDLLTQIWNKISKFPSLIVFVFFPVYPQFGNWPIMVFIFSLICAYVSILIWLAPIRNEKASYLRFFSFYFFLSCVYFSYLEIPYPWYLPPAYLIAIFAISGALLEICLNLQISEKLSKVVFATLVISTFLILLFETERMKAQQEIIEIGNRKAIGLWLKENTDKNATIFLECLGYIGYFSERKMLDWPGLVSPEVVRLIKEKRARFGDVICELKPDYLVLRDFELKGLVNNTFMLENYTPEIIFDATERIKQNHGLYGLNFLYYDSRFIILKKNKTKEVVQ